MWGESLVIVRVLLKENWHLGAAFARRLRIDRSARKAAHISCFQASTSWGTDLEQSHLARELLFQNSSAPDFENPLSCLVPRAQLLAQPCAQPRVWGHRNHLPHRSRSYPEPEPVGWRKLWPRWGVLGQQGPLKHSQVIPYRVLALSPISTSKGSTEN